MVRISLIQRFLFVLFTCFFSNVIFADQLAPPAHQTVDSFGVNVASGQIAVSLDTVSIGGELGLSHKSRAIIITLFMPLVVILVIG